MKLAICICMMLISSLSSSFAQEIEVKINKKYLNFPISHRQDRTKMTLSTTKNAGYPIVIRLAPDTPDYWVFQDVSYLKGQTLKIKYEGNPEGLKHIYQDDKIAGQDSIYIE